MTEKSTERITNGIVALCFLPSAGGRLISVRMNGCEFLWQHPDYVGPDLALLLPRSDWPEPDGTMASWVNVGGSKTWPAPQGWSGPDEWPGPPDPVLDCGSWAYRSWQESGVVFAELTSPYDDRTGLVVTRRFELPPGEPGFRQVTTFRNGSSHKIAWSMWEVCQVPADMDDSERIEVGVLPGAQAALLMDVLGPVPLGTEHDGVRTIIPRKAIGKLGIRGASGVLRYRRGDGSSLSLGFEPAPEGPYPDGGCQVELWLQTSCEKPLMEFSGLHPRHDLVELEVLSPIRTLAPGEEARTGIEWAFSVGPSVRTGPTNSDRNCDHAHH